MSVIHDRALPSSANGSNGAPVRHLGQRGESEHERDRAPVSEATPDRSLVDELDRLRAEVAAQPELLKLKRQRLTPKELQAEADLGQFEREQQRAQTRRRIRAEVRRENAAARREEKLRDLQAREEMKRAYASANLARWRNRAADQAERLTSKDMRVAQLARQLSWTKRVLVTLVVVGMAWSGVNVQHNLVPSNNTADPLFWISYGVDALLLGALVILMLTSATMSRWQQADDRTTGRLGRAGGYALEVTLTAVSLGLNTVPRMAAGDWGKAFEYAVAPLAVAVLLWVYNWSTRVLSQILATAAAEQPLQLDEHGVRLLGLAQRGFAAMAEGRLRPSTAEDGGGVPAGGQLARYLEVSKPIANDVRDLMKRIARDEVKIVA